MDRIHSYPKVYALGHAAILGILDDPVLVTEKVDGSQFSVAILDGVLHCRSKNREIDMNAPDKMFERGTEEAMGLDWRPGWIYRCEYLQKPHHNALSYTRAPDGYIILYDIEVGLQEYLSYDEVVLEAARLDLEVVPCLFEGKVTSLEQLQAMLETESALGGCKVEGVAIKNYTRFGRDGKVFMGKLVREDFKELHSKEWKKANPGGKDVVGLLVEELWTEARWQKAVQHRAENGELLGAPQDIGPLLKMIAEDVLEEEGERVRDVLFKWAWPHIRRGITRGFPEFYKARLAEQEFSVTGRDERGEDG